MRAPTSISPSHMDWDDNPFYSDAPSISVYPTDPDEEVEEAEPALFDAQGKPLRYKAKPAFGFTRDR